MYLKLRFTTGTNPYNALKILDWCINNRPATGSNIATQITTAGNATLAGLIDQNNTQVWNAGTGITALTSKTTSKFTKTAATSHTYQFYLEQEAYDNANYKHLFRITDTSSTTATAVNSDGNHFASITGSMISGITSEVFSQNSYGTATIGGSGTISGNLSAAHPTNQFYFNSTNWLGTNLTGFTIFITDNCFALFFTGAGQSIPSGVPAGIFATNGTYLRGISLAAQYTRTDPWNTSTSGIPPWVFAGTTNLNSTGNGFMNTISRFNSAQNLGFTTTAGMAHLYADRGINAVPSNAFSVFPFVERIPAALGIGNRFDDSSGLTIAAGQVGTSQTLTTQHGAALSTVAGSRFISADLKSTSYALLPMTWSNRHQNNGGGSITNRSGIYIFNGDYFPGDTLVSGTKTYILWPGSLDHANRIALAVPRE